MKAKHISARIEQCLVLAKLSNCPRRKFGALLLDPGRNVILVDGYNGGPRGASGELCGGDVCLRDKDKVVSGTRVEIGCHHAEMNVICNAAAGGIATAGAWLIVTGEPCRMCAKLIHHAGIDRVIVVDGGYAGENGVEYLQRNGVEVVFEAGPVDPRREAAPSASLRPPYGQEVVEFRSWLATLAERGIHLDMRASDNSRSTFVIFARDRPDIEVGSVRINGRLLSDGSVVEALYNARHQAVSRDRFVEGLIPEACAPWIVALINSFGGCDPRRLANDVMICVKVADGSGERFAYVFVRFDGLSATFNSITYTSPQDCARDVAAVLAEECARHKGDQPGE